MSPLIVPIAVPVALLVFVANMAAHAPFGELSRRIAEREGRQDELQAPGIEGGGLNYFEIEQWWKLWRRDYRRYGDAQLNELGDRAFKRAAVMGLLNLACASALVYALST
jgi:hypothetical protein